MISMVEVKLFLSTQSKASLRISVSFSCICHLVCRIQQQMLLSSRTSFLSGRILKRFHWMSFIFQTPSLIIVANERDRTFDLISHPLLQISFSRTAWKAHYRIQSVNPELAKARAYDTVLRMLAHQKGRDYSTKVVDWHAFISLYRNNRRRQNYNSTTICKKPYH